MGFAAMLVKKDMEFLQSHFESMKKTVLYKIVVGFYHVDFVFDGNFHTVIRIKKSFDFDFDNKKFSFDWKEDGVSIIGSCEFLNLIGRHCERAEFGQNEFQLKFIEGGYVSIAIEEEDLEILEFIGTSGPNGNKLEFYIVL